MKKLTAILLILIFAIAGYVYASTVSTTDGQNYTVTNDAGISANYTNSAIANQIAQANTTVQSDYSELSSKQQDILKDTETLTVWESVLQMAANAETAWQANQVTNNATN